MLVRSFFVPSFGGVGGDGRTAAFGTAALPCRIGKSIPVRLFTLLLRRRGVGI